MRKLVIRTEANAATATGHMRRCLNIAEAAREMGAEVAFIVAEPVSVTLPQKAGFPVFCMERIFDAFDTEVQVICEYLQHLGIGDKDDAVLLVDSYFVPASYLQAMRQYLRVAYIDDLHEQIWPVDTLICYGGYATDHDYAKEYPKTQLLLGESYMPMNRIYRDLPEHVIHDDLREVLVVSGGTDPVHFLPQFAKLVAEQAAWREIHFTLIAGALDPDLPELKRMAETLGNVTISGPIPNLKEALQNSDLVITAAGTTLYELAATGTPGICYALADNQIPNAEAFAKRELLLFAGYIHIDGFSKETLQKQLEQMRCADLRRAMSKRLRKLTDGRGAERIAQALLSE